MDSDRIGYEVVPELVKVYHSVKEEVKRLFELAPVYILDYQDSFDGDLEKAVQYACDRLERMGVLPIKTVKGLVLDALDSTLSSPNQDGILFTERGTHRPFSLMECMRSLEYSHDSTRYGMVCMYFHGGDTLERNVGRWNRLLTQIESYRDRCFFCMVVEHGSLEYLESVVGSRLFYRTLECKAPSLEEYFDYFMKRFLEYDVVINGDSAYALACKLDDVDESYFSYYALDRVACELSWKARLMHDFAETDVVSNYVAYIFKPEDLMRYSRRTDTVGRVGF